MNKEEFSKVLDKKGYSYEIQGDRIVVLERGDVYLSSLTSLPPGVEFRNEGTVRLESLTSLPSGVVFRNEGPVYLSSLTSLPPGVEFKNGWYVYLSSLTSIPPGVVFNNRGYVGLNSIIGGEFDDWEGNIEGIDSKRLLNSMIKRGMFI